MASYNLCSLNYEAREQLVMTNERIEAKNKIDQVAYKNSIFFGSITFYTVRKYK